MHSLKALCVLGVLASSAACAKEPAYSPIKGASQTPAPPVQAAPVAANAPVAVAQTLAKVSMPATTPSPPKAVVAEKSNQATAQVVRLSGKQILEQKCVTCHDITQVTGEPRASDDWAPILDRMMSIGASISPEERKTLQAYLIESYSH